MSRTGLTKPGGHGGHATGGIQDQRKEGGEYSYQPENGIWPSARAVHGLPAIVFQSIGEMVRNVE